MGWLWLTMIDQEPAVLLSRWHLMRSMWSLKERILRALVAMERWRHSTNSTTPKMDGTALWSQCSRKATTVICIDLWWQSNNDFLASLVAHFIDWCTAFHIAFFDQVLSLIGPHPIQRQTDVVCQTQLPQFAPFLVEFREFEATTKVREFWENTQWKIHNTLSVWGCLGFA